jgi:hypothetical protein
MDLGTLMATLASDGFSLSTPGCNTIELRGPMQRLTPAIRQALAEHKPTLLALLGPAVDEEREAIQREGEAGEAATAFPFGANVIDWWDCLGEDDKRELTAKREPRPACAFCGGRNHHSPQCFGQPTMPWGKHKGKPLAAVPGGYLAFVQRQGIGREETRQDIREEMKRRHRP